LVVALFLPPPRQVGGGKKKGRRHTVNRFSERVKKQKTIRPEAFSFLLFLFVVSVPNLKMWRKYDEIENLVPYTLLLAAFESYAKVVVAFFFFYDSRAALVRATRTRKWCWLFSLELPKTKNEPGWAGQHYKR
jgi:hypothetical protein